MKQKIGNMLMQLRENAGVTLKDMTRGVITISSLCRVERGEKEIDYFLLEVLFQRLGKSIDKLELILSVDEYYMLYLREQIKDCLEQARYSEADKFLEDYEQIIGVKDTIHKQYVYMGRTVTQYLQYRNVEKCYKEFNQALELTCPNWNDVGWEWKFLCVQEIRLLLMIAYMYMKGEKWNEAFQLLVRMEQYIRNYYTDQEEKVKIYPACTYLLAQVYWKRGELTRAYRICSSGKGCLIENGALALLKELLQIELDYYVYVELFNEAKKCREYLDTIVFIYELAENNMEKEEILLLLEENIQRECVISSELIRELRNAHNMTQESLCENICAQETLARIEKGRTNPNKKKFYQMLKRMGMERTRYYASIITEDYTLYEKARTYSRCVGKNDRELARSMLREIEKKLDMSISINRQYVASGRIREQLWDEIITYEQAIENLKEVLAISMKPIKGKDLVYRVPFRKEFMILNQMALCYKKNGQIDVANEIYRKIEEKYKNSNISMKCHALPGFTLYANYTGFLEVSNELEQALKVGISGIKHAVLCNRADLTGPLLANMFCIYIKQHQLEVAEKYLRKSGILLELYNRERDNNIVKELYKKTFGEQY